MVYSVRCRYFAALVGRQWECFSNELRTVLLRLKRAFSLCLYHLVRMRENTGVYCCHDNRRRQESQNSNLTCDS